jgi:hypothetical protein
MRSRASFVFAVSLASVAVDCSSAVQSDAGNDADTALDFGASLNDADTASDFGAHSMNCGSQVCAAGQLCCLLDGTCFDAACADCCRLPVDAGVSYGGVPTGSHTCASRRDCDPGQACFGPSCLGVGYCASASADGPNCTLNDPRCGCDGVTYPNECAILNAGVRTAVEGVGCFMPTQEHEGGAPSVTGCGPGGACPPGTACCTYWGLCMRTDCPTCCRPAPPGTRFPCSSDGDCRSNEFCGGVIGCSALGGCRSPDVGCSGVLDPVCGCDGHTYANACWAGNAGVRVASPGPCG